MYSILYDLYTIVPITLLAVPHVQLRLTSSVLRPHLSQGAS